jgi:phosphoadenosine phosphosulfate reductase
MALFKNGAVVPDPWQRIDSIDDLPQDGNVLLSVEQWRHFASSHPRANIACGLLLEPGTEVEDFAEDYARLALVAINFPKFVDGRGYSMGRKIRERFGFSGELRAAGDILFDQLQFLARCGFDAFEITDHATLELIAQGRRSGVDHFYQPGFGHEVPAGTRPWARRPSSQ